MQIRSLGPLKTSALGLGCMGLTHAYGAPVEESAGIALIRRAVELGVAMFDTAEVYGPYTNEVLLGKALKGLRDQVTIATKFGFRIAPESAAGVDRMIGVDGSPANARKVCEESLKRLGVETIDLYYLHRPDPSVAIEESVGAMAELVREGKVRCLGLSECDAPTIRRAHAVHPIAALQSEYSLWTRGIEAEILPTIRELGIGLVPFAPLGRGFLAGAVTSADQFSASDFRRKLPRFQADAVAANARFVDAIQAVASAHGATRAQIALAWVLAKGEDVVPIPGTTKIARLEENLGAAAMRLSPQDVAALENAIPPEAVFGARYAGGAWSANEKT